MKHLASWFGAAFVRGVSWLPLPVLYALGDVAAVVLRRIVRYRRAVVDANLARAFPEKPAAERTQLARAYYRWLGELVAETLYARRMSAKAVRKRVRFSDDSLVRVYNRNHRAVLLLLGHWGNWEWAGHGAALLLNQPVAAVYRPLSDPVFDRLLRRLRTRFGRHIVPEDQLLQHLRASRQTAMLTFVLADQSPPKAGAHWLDFLGTPTPFHRGPEVMARRANLPVVYGSIRRLRRGYYEIDILPLAEDTAALPPGELTRNYALLLQASISSAPERWLWSHKRWKHAPEAAKVAGASSKTPHVATDSRQQILDANGQQNERHNAGKADHAPVPQPAVD